VQADWRPVPTAAQVYKALEKNARRHVRTLLDAEPAPSEAQLAHAAKLLEGRDPAAVVATLVALATPALPCEPRAIAPVEPLTDRRRPHDRREPRRAWRDERERGRDARPAHPRSRPRSGAAHERP